MICEHWDREAPEKGPSGTIDHDVADSHHTIVTEPVWHYWA